MSCLKSRPNLLLIISEYPTCSRPGQGTEAEKRTNHCPFPAFIGLMVNFSKQTREKREKITVHMNGCTKSMGPPKGDL